MADDGFCRFGKLHADWPVVRLRSVAKHRREWTTIRDDCDYVRVTARLRNKGVELRDCVAGSAITTKKQQVVRAGDLLVAEIDAKVGGFGIVPSALDGAIVSSHYFLFEIDESRLMLPWLDQLVRGGQLHRQVDAVGSTNYAAIRPGDVLTFQIPLPPVEEQKCIAGILDSLDATITASRAHIDQLVCAKHAVMRELLTLGHPAHRTKLVPLSEPWRMGRIAPEIERVPQHWHLVTLTGVARLESGHTPSRNHPEYWDGEIPWISLQDTEGLKQLVISETVETTGTLGIKNSSARVLPKDTVVFSRTASVGLVSRMGCEMATSQDFANWICGPQLTPRYLVQVFRHMDREWRRLQAGSTHQTVYMPVFKKLKILLPPRDEQDAIADVGDAFDVRVLAEQSYLKQLRETKHGLAQALLSGRVRVPTAGTKRGTPARGSRGG